jgi:hypothetical protein
VANAAQIVTGQQYDDELAFLSTLAPATQLVHPADIRDRDGGVLVTATLFGMFPFLKTLFADSRYQGPKFAKALAKVLPHLDLEIVTRSDQIRGFVALPKRWIVERTIAFSIAAEGSPRIGESQPKGARILAPRLNRLMVRKLCKSGLISGPTHIPSLTD